MPVRQFVVCHLWVARNKVHTVVQLIVRVTEENSIAWGNEKQEVIGVIFWAVPAFVSLTCTSFYTFACVWPCCCLVRMCCSVLLPHAALACHLRLLELSCPLFDPAISLRAHWCHVRRPAPCYRSVLPALHFQGGPTDDQRDKASTSNTDILASITTDTTDKGPSAPHSRWVAQSPSPYFALPRPRAGMTI